MTKDELKRRVWEAIDLLADGAAGAREVRARARPRLTRAEYLAFQRGLTAREVFEG